MFTFTQFEFADSRYNKPFVYYFHKMQPSLKATFIKCNFH